MNIIHFIEKIPFLHSEIVEKAALPYMIILYLVDVFCSYKAYVRFKEPVWQCLIPFYNWKVFFEYCWELKAFYEHLAIEVCGLLLPVMTSLLSKGLVFYIFVIIDLLVACMGLKHSFEIGVFILRSYGYEVKKYIWSIFVFDIVLILTANREYLGNKSSHH